MIMNMRFTVAHQCSRCCFSDCAEFHMRTNYHLNSLITQRPPLPGHRRCTFANILTFSWAPQRTYYMLAEGHNWINPTRPQSTHPTSGFEIYVYTYIGAKRAKRAIEWRLSKISSKSANGDGWCVYICEAVTRQKASRRKKNDELTWWQIGVVWINMRTRITTDMRWVRPFDLPSIFVFEIKYKTCVAQHQRGWNVLILSEIMNSSIWFEV